MRELRLARHLSQEGLAEELGVSTRYLAGVERGERNLTLDSVDALAEQLGVEAHALIVRRRCLGRGVVPRAIAAGSTTDQDQC